MVYARICITYGLIAERKSEPDGLSPASACIINRDASVLCRGLFFVGECA